jgi:hypothetical protein
MNYTTTAITSGVKVFVYRNLNNGVWSVKSLLGSTYGRVIMHATDVLLVKPEFKVSEAGRQRVLREGRKNVHAGVVGDLIMAYGYQRQYDIFGTTIEAAHNLVALEYGDEVKGLVTYNPYKYSSFVYKDNEQPVGLIGGAKVLLDSDFKVSIINN